MAADFGTKLFSVKPGTVLISINWKLFSLSLIKSTLPQPLQPKQEKAWKENSLTVSNSTAFKSDFKYSVSFLIYFASKS